MKHLNLIQGSQAWLDHRATSFNASEAAAMLGLSNYQTRQDLLRQKATGLCPEINAATQALFDKGHQAEAMFRFFAEEIIGEDLYPVVGMIELGGMRISCSFDGLTMDETVAFEHKLWNEKLAAFIKQNNDVPETHWPQLEQALLVSDAEKVLFVTSDGTDSCYESLMYRSKPERRARLIAGWKQFAIDLANYQHSEPVREAVAEPIAGLPALFIQAEGRVISSNLEPFKSAVTAMIDGIKTELVTDQDFADADAMAKHLKDGENRLEQAKSAALAQTASLDELFRAVDDMAELMRQKRLTLEKLVKSEKESRKAVLVMAAKDALFAYEGELNTTIASNYMSHAAHPFADAIKGKKSLQSMNDALDAALANAKIDAMQIAVRIQKMIDAVNKAEAFHLFPDFRTIARTPIDAEPFSSMIAQRKQAEASRLAEAAARAAVQAKADEDMVAAQVIPIIHPVQRTDADLVREFMKKRGIDDPKTRAVLVEFVRYVRAHDAEKAA